MDLEITDDQRVLLDASGRLMHELCPLDRVRARAHDDPAVAAAYRSRAAELGWFSMLVPEQLGGGSISGNGVVDAALIAYQRGAALQPGPFVSTNVVAWALARSGAATNQEMRDVLHAIMAGTAAATWVVSAPAVLDQHGRELRAVRTNGRWMLSGRATFVLDAGPASRLLVTASTDGGPAQFLLSGSDVPDVRTIPLESLDLTRRFNAVEFRGTPVDDACLVGEPGQVDDLVAHQLALACVLSAAETVGAMQQDFEMTLQYAKDRTAFGRPIGSFQSIKHLLSDTSLFLETSKAVTLAAATSLGSPDGGSPDGGSPDGGSPDGGYGLEAASIAKSFVGEHGIELAQNCFQVFGGIGYTWEHDQHLYLRRITTDAVLFGDPVWHREHLCRLSGLDGFEPVAEGVSP